MQEKFDELGEKCKQAIGNFTEEEGEVSNLVAKYRKSAECDFLREAREPHTPVISRRVSKPRRDHRI